MAQPPEQTGADSSQDGVTKSAAVERRIWRNTLVISAIALVVAAVLADLRFTVGVATGASLSLLNFWWLRSSLRAVLAVGGRKAPPGTTMRFLLRWLIVLSAVFTATRTGYVDVAGLAIGLFAPSAAILAEAAYLGFKTAALDGGER